jgi:hypothetical protein
MGGKYNRSRPLGVTDRRAQIYVGAWADSFQEASILTTYDSVEDHAVRLASCAILSHLLTHLVTPDR